MPQDNINRHAEHYLCEFSADLFPWIVFCTVLLIGKLSARQINHHIQPPGSATCIQPPDSGTWTRPLDSTTCTHPVESCIRSDAQFLGELRSLDLNPWTLKALQTTCRTPCRTLAQAKRRSACEPNSEPACEPACEPAFGTSVGTHAGTSFGPACEPASRTQCRTQRVYDLKQKPCLSPIHYSFH